VSRQAFEALAPFLNDGAFIWLAGCKVGLNAHYCDWICDDAGPGSVTLAAPCDVFGLAQLPDGFVWIWFNGYTKPQED